MKLTFTELQKLILKWASDKSLIAPQNADKQRLKLIEEIGEIAGAIVKNKTDEIKDGIGDVIVVLTILAAQLDEKIDLDVRDDLISLSHAELLSGIIYFENYGGYSHLIELCNRLSLDPIECLNLAWNEIKNRTGKTVGGAFIKD